MNLSVYQNVLPFEAKHFYRRMETILSGLDSASANEWSARMFLSAFQNEFGDVLQIGASHLYELLSNRPQLLSSRGESLPEIGSGLRDQFKDVDSPWFSNFNGRFTAVIPFDQKGSLVLVFFARENAENQQFLCWAFSSIHYALIQHYRRLSLHNVLEQATAVQLSLLPANAPQYPGFEIAAKSIPAKIVGGDVYDFQNGNGESLWLMIADAAGHGLTVRTCSREPVPSLKRVRRAARPARRCHGGSCSQVMDRKSIEL